MDQRLEKSLNHYLASNELLQLIDIKRGIERETLRTDLDGRISQARHPLQLGSALTHPLITTDYSEALLEFITPPQKLATLALAYMQDIHKFVHQHLANELLWPFSMPNRVNAKEVIPIATYGSSNLGKMKNLYRIGLHHRYGSMMQIIAGIHYNFSMPDSFWQSFGKLHESQKNLKDLKSESYLGMIRNFKRISWLIPYIFGASPTVDVSFLSRNKDRGLFKEYDDKGTMHIEGATSLRLSDFGYQNSSQSQINISYNNLDEYVNGLIKATQTTDPKWERLGTVIDGKAIQLNTSILQIENEYYSFIRPKQITHAGERPSSALMNRGIEYVEIRSVDVNPYAKAGISLEQIYFLDTLLTYCLFKGSPLSDKKEEAEEKANYKKVIYQGRKANLTLKNNNENISLTNWLKNILEELIPVAKMLDTAYQTNCHNSSLNHFGLMVEHPELTLSGRMLSEMKANNESHLQFARRKADQYQKEFFQDKYQVADETLMLKFATESLIKQKQLEEDDKDTFSNFLERYFHKSIS